MSEKWRIQRIGGEIPGALSMNDRAHLAEIVQEYRRKTLEAEVEFEARLLIAGFERVFYIPGAYREFYHDGGEVNPSVERKLKA